MPVEQTFTQEQVLFLFNQMFDVLKSDFNYDLGSKKRKILFSRVFKARNFDALIQRASNVVQTTISPVFSCYQWYQPVMIDGEYRHLNIGDRMTDEVVLSEIQFATCQEAIQAIETGSWGPYPEDLENAVLVKVNHYELPNPFSKQKVKISPDSCEVNLSLLNDARSTYKGISTDFTMNVSRDASAMAIKVNQSNMPTYLPKTSMDTGKTGVIIRTGNDLKNAIDMSGVLNGLNCTDADALYIDDNFCDVILSVDFGTNGNYVNIEMSLDLYGDTVECRPIRLEVIEKQTGFRGNSVTLMPEYKIEDWINAYRRNGYEAGTLLPENMLEKLFNLVQEAYPKVIEPWLGKAITK